MKTNEQILNILKTSGEQTAKALAQKLGLTTMGVRQHLLLLEEDGQLAWKDRKASRGRPTRFWRLTELSNEHFDDQHAELTVQLITSVKNVFGDEGLNELISHREQQMAAEYSAALNKVLGLEARLVTLASIRSREGYMAVVESDAEGYWLLENHCPICAAAKHCLDFCRSELQLFQQLFAKEARIHREEHIIDGARRCAYRVIPL